jgi:hypothetical protein
MAITVASATVSIKVPDGTSAEDQAAVRQRAKQIWPLFRAALKNGMEIKVVQSVVKPVEVELTDA